MQLESDDDSDILMSELKKEMVHGKNSLKLKDLWKKTFFHRRRDILENPRLTVQICEEYPLYRKASFVSCFCGYGLQGHIQVSLEFELIQHKNGLKSLFVKNWITCKLQFCVMLKTPGIHQWCFGMHYEMKTLMKVLIIVLYIICFSVI